MEQYRLDAIEQDAIYTTLLMDTYFNSGIKSCRKIGEGFYGAVYFVESDKPPHKLVVKWYKHARNNERESSQLKLLGKHSLIKVPEVYAIHRHSDDLPYEAMMMEFIDGVNAGGIEIEDAVKQNRFADRIIDNLLALHAVTNPQGFGEEGAVPFPDWTACYRSKVDRMYAEITSVRFAHIVSPVVMDTIERSYDLFDRVFRDNPATASLVHSDYNLWNILVNPHTLEPAAIIDPFDAGWADKEIDLFHLQNANGDRFRLLDRYRSQAALSDLFDVKNAYYRFWDDIKHLIHVGWYEEEHFRTYGGKLEKQLRDKITG